MAHANCSVCNGEINTESSPSGKCVRCLEVEAAGKPAAGKPAAAPAGAAMSPPARLQASKEEAAGERPPALQEHVGPKGTVLMPAKPADPEPAAPPAPPHEESADHDRQGHVHAHSKATKHK